MNKLSQMIEARYDVEANAASFEERATRYLGGLPSCFQYREASAGSWSIEKMSGNAIACSAYFTGLMMVPPSVRLMRGEELWMSLAPMEIESQFPHFAAAADHCKDGKGVLIAGLGLGYMVGQFCNMARKGQIDGPIVVLERDCDVVECFLRSLRPVDLDMLNECHVDIVSGVDALTWKSEDEFGLITADIWLTLNSEEARTETRMMAENIPNHDAISWWGAELDYLGWMSENYEVAGNEGPDTWADYCEAVGMKVYGKAGFLETREFYDDCLSAAMASLDRANLTQSHGLTF